MYRLALMVTVTIMIAACGGSGESDDVPGNPFEGVGEAAEGVELPQAGPLTAQADPGHTWVEVDGDRLEFSNTESELLDCIVNDEQLSVIYRNDDLSEVRLSGLLLPDGWNLSLNLRVGEEGVINGASLRGGTFGMERTSVSYEGVVETPGGASPQVDLVLAANCSA